MSNAAIEVDLTRLLFIDDNLQAMRDICQSLEDDGFEVTRAFGVDSAIAELTASHSKFDIVILDIMMPPGDKYANVDTDFGNRTGLLFLEYLREEVPEIPVLIFSNFSPFHLRAEVRESSMVSILQKKRVTEGDASLSGALRELLAVPSWYDDVHEDALELLSLEDGWNGGRERKIDRRILLAALEVLKSLASDTGLRLSVVPTFHSGVQLELHSLTADFELEFLSETSVAMFLQDRGKVDERLFELDENYREELSGLLRKMFGGQ